MTIAISGDTAETFNAAGCRFRVLDDGTPTSGRSGVVELTLPPAWGGPPQHIHREHDETFYVLSGTVQFTSGTDILLATPGQLVTAPIGDPHTFANPDPDAPASLLCTLTPERYLSYFRELSELTLDSSGRPNPAEIMELMARYATEPVRP
ncbi:MAG: cupin domain-containing protein [Actinomycetota bacterium]|nr:cupin domain-containing protein [Actinomycetota bacterium]